MLKYRWFAILILITLVGCTYHYDSREYTVDDSLPPQPTAAQMQECPYGHHALKDVPLIVGLLWMSPELEKKIANVEVWPAGCSSIGIYKTKVVCMECGLAYDPVRNVWERRLNWGNIAMHYRPTSP